MPSRRASSRCDRGLGPDDRARGRHPRVLRGDGGRDGFRVALRRALIRPVKLVTVLDIGTDPADEPDLRIRKRTAVAAALAFMVGRRRLRACGSGAGAAGLLGPRVSSRSSPSGRPWCCSAGAVGSHPSSRRWRSSVWPSCSSASIPSGGLSWSAINLIWIILVPIAAVLFLGARAGPPALAGVILVVVGRRRHRSIHPKGATGTIARQAPVRGGRSHRRRPRSRSASWSSSMASVSAPRRSPTPCCSMSCPARSPIG